MQAIGLYITDLAGQGRAVSPIERRLSGICSHFRQKKLLIDRSDPRIREILAGIRNEHSRVPTQKATVAATDIIAMIGMLDTGLVGIRDRAILPVDFADGLRCSEIVGLDHEAGDTDEGLGWPEFLPGGVVLRIRGKGNRWREVEVGRGSSSRTCPAACLEGWMAIVRIVHGPVFRRIAAKRVHTERPSHHYVARLVQRTAIAAGVRGGLAQGARREAFAGHSLRASSAEVDERYVQRQLGHATVTMTRRYQRERDRFRVNLTKAAGL